MPLEVVANRTWELTVSDITDDGGALDVAGMTAWFGIRRSPTEAPVVNLDFPGLPAGSSIELVIGPVDVPAGVYTYEVVLVDGSDRPWTLERDTITVHDDVVSLP